MLSAGCCHWLGWLQRPDGCSISIFCDDVTLAFCGDVTIFGGADHDAHWRRVLGHNWHLGHHRAGRAVRRSHQGAPVQPPRPHVRHWRGCGHPHQRCTLWGEFALSKRVCGMHHCRRPPAWQEPCEVSASRLRACELPEWPCRCALVMAHAPGVGKDRPLQVTCRAGALPWAVMSTSPARRQLPDAA